MVAKPRVLIDPNKWSKDGTISLAGTAVSPEAKYLAYGKSESGSDWRTWHVLDVRTGKDLGDELNWLKFTNISWTNDGQGFFYSRYPEPKKGEKYQGREETMTLQGADAAGYDGKAVRKSVDNALDIGQADTRAFEFIGPVQALEDTK